MAQNPYAKSSDLCLACSLCCRGLFFYHQTNPQRYGVAIDSTNKTEQPFPLCCKLLIDDRCYIHQHPQRPKICKDYQCQLLKNYMDDRVSLDFALRMVTEIKGLFYRIKDYIEIDKTKPAFYLIQDTYASMKKEKIINQQKVEQAIEILSLLRLVHQYILPFEGGFLSR